MKQVSSFLLKTHENYAIICLLTKKRVKMSLKLNESQIKIGLTSNSFLSTIALFFKASIKVSSPFLLGQIARSAGASEMIGVAKTVESNRSIFQKHSLMCEAHEGGELVFRGVPRVRRVISKNEMIRRDKFSKTYCLQQYQPNGLFNTAGTAHTVTLRSRKSSGCRRY